jgi:LysM repeat protein
MLTTYRVRKGDTLGKIAARFYGDAGRFPLIVSANVIMNPDQLIPGQTLTIPDAAARENGAPAAVPPPLRPAPPTPLPTLTPDGLRDCIRW